MAAVAWIHSMCGRVSHFPQGVDPNRTRAVCPKCWVALGDWQQALARYNNDDDRINGLSLIRPDHPMWYRRLDSLIRFGLEITRRYG